MKSSRQTIFVTILGGVLACGVQAKDNPGSVPNRVIVKFRQDALMNVMSGDSTLESYLAPEMGVSDVETQLTEDSIVVRYATNLKPREAAAALHGNRFIQWAQPDYILSLFPDVAGEESDYNFGLNALSSITKRVFDVASKPKPVSAPALPNPLKPDTQIADAWGLAKIAAEKAWEINRGSHKVLVADIDTGIDYRHEDLVNNLFEGIGYDFVNNDELPYDDNNHGTHTAGTIGATGGNGIGVAGVSPEVSIMSLKFLSGSGSGTTSDAVRAVDYAVERGARVLSNSWGGRVSDTDEEEVRDNKALSEAIDRAGAKNVLFVAAAGNDGTNNDNDPVYPAAFDKPNMLTVASTSNRDSRSFFSNYGVKTVHVGAPGSGILSTAPNNEYIKLSGTSMACPHVAGLAALILSARPELTAVQVKKIIMDTVDKIPALDGKTVTGGRINARAALEGALRFGI